MAPLVLALVGLDLGWWGVVVGEPHQRIARDLFRALTAPRVEGNA